MKSIVFLGLIWLTIAVIKHHEARNPMPTPLTLLQKEIRDLQTAMIFRVVPLAGVQCLGLGTKVPGMQPAIKAWLDASASQYMGCVCMNTPYFIALTDGTVQETLLSAPCEGADWIVCCPEANAL